MKSLERIRVPFFDTIKMARKGKRDNLSFLRRRLGETPGLRF